MNKTIETKAMQAHTIMPISTELNDRSADFDFCVVSSFDGSVAQPCVEIFSDVNVVVCVVFILIVVTTVLVWFWIMDVVASCVSGFSEN